MKQDLIVSILMAMMPVLSEAQLDALKLQLNIKMAAYSVECKSTELVVYDNSDLGIMCKFLEAKASSRKSKGTINNYRRHIQHMIESIGKRLDTIDEDDLNLYLYRYQKERGINKTTARNIRASLSSFFGWMRKTGRISKNPMDLVEPIKPDQTIKEVFTDEQIIRMREECRNKRDLAIIDFLNASMIRVGELVGLNREDIEFHERECIVFGKGSKERIAYFDGAAKLHLQDYLESRKDKNAALFVTLKPFHGQYRRLAVCGVQEALRQLGKRVKIRVHPHKFRRSGATRNLEKGMDLYDLKDILGHVKVETTLIYAKKRRKLIKINYEKYNM